MSKPTVWANLHSSSAGYHWHAYLSEAMAQRNTSGTTVRVAVPLYEHPPVETYDRLPDNAPPEVGKVYQDARLGPFPVVFTSVGYAPPALTKRRVRWEDSKARAWWVLQRSPGMSGPDSCGCYEVQCQNAEGRFFTGFGRTKIAAVNALRRKVEGRRG